MSSITWEWNANAITLHWASNDWIFFPKSTMNDDIERGVMMTNTWSSTSIHFQTNSSCFKAIIYSWFDSTCGSLQWAMLDNGSVMRWACNAMAYGIVVFSDSSRVTVVSSHLMSIRVVLKWCQDSTGWLNWVYKETEWNVTLFCSETRQLALMRMRITPAWPYRALVCNGVSPYCNQIATTSNNELLTWPITINYFLHLFWKLQRRYHHPLCNFFSPSNSSLSQSVGKLLFNLTTDRFEESRAQFFWGDIKL